MRFWQLGLDNALALDPEAPDWTGRRLVRLIAGNPVTMGQMTRHVADAGSYAPVTILIEETPDGGTRVAYDSVVSALSRSSCQNRIKPARPCACSTRELNCW